MKLTLNKLLVTSYKLIYYLHKLQKNLLKYLELECILIYSL
jgi:hypothetical protein